MDRTMRNNRFVIAAALLVIILLAALSTWWFGNRPGHDGQLRQITIAQFGDFFLYAPLYVAVDGGFFVENGLQVTIVNTGGDDKTWAAVLSGSAQFGVADPTFVAVSAARGENGVVVASLVNGVPFWGITFRDIPPLADPKELSTYSVATFPSPSTAYALQSKMFSDAGLAPNIREAGFGAIIPLLKARGADIGLELEPNVSQAVSDGASIVYSMAERYGDFAITGVTTTDLIAQQDPGLIQGVRASLQRALDMLHAEPDRAIGILANRFPGVPEEIAKSALHRVLADGVVPISTTISRDAWEKAIQLRITVGDLESAAPYDKFVWPAN